MTLLDALHQSTAHREGFDPDCPLCLRAFGVKGIIKHLQECVRVNEADGFDGDGSAKAVANEQRRMIKVLKLYQKWKAK